MQLQNIPQIARLIEKFISIDQLSTNPRFVSYFSYTGFIPLNDILASLTNFTISIENAITACATSEALSKSFRMDPTPCLTLPYRVVPGTLILSNISSKVTFENIKLFIRKLVGSNEFDLEKKPTVWIVKFNAAENATNFWRAIKYVPLQGLYIQAAPQITEIVPPEHQKKPKSNNKTMRKDSEPKFKYQRRQYYSKHNTRRTSSVNNSTSSTFKTDPPKPVFQIIKRKEYMSEAPSIVIESTKPGNFMINK